MVTIEIGVCVDEVYGFEVEEVVDADFGCCDEGVAAFDAFELKKN